MHPMTGRLVAQSGTLSVSKGWDGLWGVLEDKWLYAGSHKSQREVGFTVIVGKNMS